MRKRSRYRPRRVLLDNMAHVQAGVQRVRTTGEAQLNLRIRNHAALDEVRSGRGDFDHSDILVMALNAAQALARLGVGRDWMDEIMAGQHVTAAMCARGLAGKGYEFTGAELPAIDLAMRVHDAQLDDCTVAQLESAVNMVLREIKHKRVTVIGQGVAN